jgi:hypothetical protein
LKYRPKSSYVSKDPEKRARSLANLKRGKKLGSQTITSPLAFAEGLFLFEKIVQKYYLT